MYINNPGIEWIMFNFIQNFLKPRFFKIQVNEILSDAKVQTEGLPQGSVVSPTCFILKIKKIIAQLSIENIFQIKLYVDELQISYCHPNWRVVEKKLQVGVKIVEKFVQKNSSKFPTSITSVLHFTKLLIQPQIEIWLGDLRFQKNETVKYLELVFDSKLDWRAHA